MRFTTKEGEKVKDAWYNQAIRHLELCQEAFKKRAEIYIQNLTSILLTQQNHLDLNTDKSVHPSHFVASLFSTWNNSETLPPD
jgi:hypothetical protein